MNKLQLVMASMIFLLSGIAFSQQTLFNQQMQIGFEEKQGQYVASDVRLVNESGDTVLLGDVLKKPTILSLVYFNCPGTCSPLMWGISKFIDGVDLQLGKDYDVITISFDPSEKIDLGKKKKVSYLNTMTKKEAAENWHFFVSDSANIARLTKSVGFNYQMVNGQYIHPTGLIALAQDGKIVRYLRGIEFLPFDIKITMVEAAKGKIGPSINRLLAVCYSYDNEGNKFVFNVTRVSAVVITFFVVLLFLFLALSRIKLKSKVNK